MNQQTTPDMTLFDLLARSWQRPSPVRHICFNDDETALAVVTEDGGVAYARMADNEPPEARIVSEAGQTGIRPRNGRPSPLIMTRLKGAGRVCPAGAGGFLTADDRHRLIRLSRAGEIADTVFEASSPIIFDRSEASGDIAIVSDGMLHWHGCPETAGTVPLGDFSPSHVILSPDGSRLALAGTNRIEVRDRGSQGPLLALPPQGEPIAMAWSAAGDWLAVGMEKDGMVLIETASGRHARLEGFPGPVRTVGFDARGAVVAAGAYRIAGWSTDTPPMEDAATGAISTGRAGLAMVEAVAVQSRGDLVAAGYANGQIVIARLGSSDQMILRGAGGPVTALAWTADGRHLAIGDALGMVAIATFPAQLFK